METRAAARSNLEEARKRARATARPHLASRSKLQHRQARCRSPRRLHATLLPPHTASHRWRWHAAALPRHLGGGRHAGQQAGIAVGPGSASYPLKSSLQRCRWGTGRERAEDGTIPFQLARHPVARLSYYSLSHILASLPAKLIIIISAATSAPRSSTANSSKSASLPQTRVTAQRRLALSTTASLAIDFHRAHKPTISYITAEPAPAPDAATVSSSKRPIALHNGRTGRQQRHQ